MEPVPNAIVYVVDDDADVREALAWLLRSRRLLSECFESAEAFEQMLAEQTQMRHPSCLLLDMRLGEGSGCPLMFQVLKAACAVMNDMATFPEAAIEDDYLDEIRAGDSFTVETP